MKPDKIDVAVKALLWTAILTIAGCVAAVAAHYALGLSWEWVAIAVLALSATSDRARASLAEARIDSLMGRK